MTRTRMPPQVLVAAFVAAVAGCVSFPSGAQSLGSPATEGPARWSTFVTAGPQLVESRFGGELSLIRVTFDGHLAGGGGLVTGADATAGYGEIEGILIITPHDEKSASMGHEYPFWYVTGGLGAVARWEDGAPGVQATVSSTLLVLPLTLVARAQRFRGDAAIQLTWGLMLKIPVWARW